MMNNKAVGLVMSVMLGALAGCGSMDEKPFVPPVFPSPPDEPRFIYDRTIRSSMDIKELSGSDKLKLFATGATDSAVGLAKPYGVAVKEGRVYVSDTQQRAILLFDVPNGTTKIIGTEGPGTLLKPLGLDISPNGDIYVADNTAKRVVVFNKDGDFLQALGSAKELKRPSGVALSPDGSKAYVVDTAGIDSEDHKVYVYDTATGDLLKSIGKRGTGEGEFNLPVQASTAPDGTLYVVDGGNFRVVAFTPDGAFKRAWGEAGRRSGNFSRPKGVATDKDGNVYVIDTAFGNFQLFNDAGLLLMHVGSRGSNGGAAEFFLPAGIDVDEDGRIYVIDQYFRKIDIIKPIGLSAEDGYLGNKYREKIKAQQRVK